MKTLHVIHAGEDARHAETLKKHLALQIRQGLIKLVDEVASADIVACLVSNDFNAEERATLLSEEARRRNQAGLCRLIPVFVGHVADVPDHLIRLTPLPRSGRPATTDEHWAQVAAGIRAVAQSPQC